ncbi:MAG: protein phosphatase 2C domain-containing protein [Myxococcales bacterium]|nr:protein phosphatase 2C domain-containing protein [Myxococcales bacterium]
MTDDLRTSFDLPLRVSIQSDVGKVRSNNEDSAGHAWLDDGALFVIVADGMGGHEAGEVASGLAVRVLEEVVARDADVDPRERLYKGLLEANDAILEEGKASGTRGMGTTAIAAILKGSEVHVGLVGDSRLYHVRKGQLVWRTLDHTRVQVLIDNGEIDEEEAREHPESGMLTRALGHSRMADGRPLAPDVLAEPLSIEADDVLIMCSDGLHDLVEDWEISKMVAGREPSVAAAELVQVARDRGGHDNITVAVITAGSRSADYDPEFVPVSAADATQETLEIADDVVDESAESGEGLSADLDELAAEVQVEETREGVVPPEVAKAAKRVLDATESPPGSPASSTGKAAQSPAQAGAEPEAEPKRQRLLVGIAAFSLFAVIGVAAVLVVLAVVATWFVSS